MININQKLNDYCAISKREFNDFYVNNPTAKFKEPTDSAIVERMVRCGIESRYLNIDNEDDLRRIAGITLQRDYIKYYLRDLK